MLSSNLDMKVNIFDWWCEVIVSFIVHLLLLFHNWSKFAFLNGRSNFTFIFFDETLFVCWIKYISVHFFFNVALFWLIGFNCLDYVWFFTGNWTSNIALWGLISFYWILIRRLFILRFLFFQLMRLWYRFFLLIFIDLRWRNIFITMLMFIWLLNRISSYWLLQWYFSWRNFTSFSPWIANTPHCI